MSAIDHEIINPGSCIGILGGGQLGKMTAMAAARLGYRTVIWTPPGDVPATHVATRSILKPYDSIDAMEEFAELADVATIEFENIPVDLLRALNAFMPIRPSADVLEVTQDRWREKQLFQSLAIPAAPTWPVGAQEGLEITLDHIKFPGILKTRRLGYDGKGQVAIPTMSEVTDAWHGLGKVPCVLEEKIDFVCECSVIVARSPQGEIKTYPLFENEHDGGILRTTRYPGGQVSEEARASAVGYAKRIATALKLEGILAVEMFFTADGRILANELAPRPHNSGHGTIEAFVVSQFEQHVRAVCNLPLGITHSGSSFVMENLIGVDVDRWPAVLEEPGATLHLYGKTETKPGRKMGHVTVSNR